jgi:hypothetical protein
MSTTHVHLHFGPHEVGVAQMEVPQQGELIAMGTDLFRVKAVHHILRPAQSLRKSFDEYQIDVVLDEI